MKHFLGIEDVSREEAEQLLALAAHLKQQLRTAADAQRQMLAGRSIALIFEKPSLRTRVALEVGVHQLGAHAVSLSATDIGMGLREGMSDVARVLGRMCDGLAARVNNHETLVELARYAGVPVVNSLSDREHPCQALADLLTLQEHKGLRGCKIAYVGDGNNVCHSLMLLCAKLGVSFAAGVPAGYEPAAAYIEAARREGEVEITHDPYAAVAGADAVYTDVWTSMGQEAESEHRLRIFPPYQVNRELMSHAKRDAIVLHCLPAHRGEEITHEIMESARSVVFDQAENRLHAHKAVLIWLLGTS